MLPRVFPFEDIGVLCGLFRSGFFCPLISTPLRVQRFLMSVFSLYFPLLRFFLQPVFSFLSQNRERDFVGGLTFSGWDSVFLLSFYRSASNYC